MRKKLVFLLLFLLSFSGFAQNPLFYDKDTFLLKNTSVLKSNILAGEGISITAETNGRITIINEGSGGPTNGLTQAQVNTLVTNNYIPSLRSNAYYQSGIAASNALTATVNLSNLSYALSLANSNLSYALGVEGTNKANAVLAASSNLAYTLGLNLSNYISGLPIGGEATNTLTKQESTNLTQTAIAAYSNNVTSVFTSLLQFGSYSNTVRTNLHSDTAYLDTVYISSIPGFINAQQVTNAINALMPVGGNGGDSRSAFIQANYVDTTNVVINFGLGTNWYVRLTNDTYITLSNSAPGQGGFIRLVQDQQGLSNVVHTKFLFNPINLITNQTGLAVDTNANAVTYFQYLFDGTNALLFRLDQDPLWKIIAVGGGGAATNIDTNVLATKIEVLVLGTNLTNAVSGRQLANGNLDLVAAYTTEEMTNMINLVDLTSPATMLTDTITQANNAGVAATNAQAFANSATVALSNQIDNLPVGSGGDARSAFVQVSYVDNTNVVFNLGLGTNFYLKVTNNFYATLSNATPGQSGFIRLVQDQQGLSNAVHTSFLWNPVNLVTNRSGLSFGTNANEVMILQYVFDGTNGVIWRLDQDPLWNNSGWVASTNGNATGLTVLGSLSARNVRRSILEFGADTNGLVDSAGAINTAIAAGGTIWAPKGTYLVNSPIVMSTGIRFEADTGARFAVPSGYTNTALIFSNSYNADWIGGEFYEKAPLSNLWTGVQFANGSGGGTYFNAIRNVLFTKPQTAINFYANLTNSSWVNGNLVDGCRAFNATCFIDWTYDGQSTWMTNGYGFWYNVVQDFFGQSGTNTIAGVRNICGRGNTFNNVWIYDMPASGSTATVTNAINATIQSGTLGYKNFYDGGLRTRIYDDYQSAHVIGNQDYWATLKDDMGAFSYDTEGFNSYHVWTIQSNEVMRAVSNAVILKKPLYITNIEGIVLALGDAGYYARLNATNDFLNITAFGGGSVVNLGGGGKQVATITDKYVGIGTNNPQAALHVRGATLIESNVWIATNATFPTPLAGGGWLCNSNQALYWVTPIKTNLISNGL